MEENKKRLKLFLILVFVLTYTFEFIVIWPATKNPDAQGLVTTYEMIAMFIPAITSIIVRFITKEGFADTYIALNIKGNIKYYVFAWFGPTVFTLLGMVIFFLLNPNQFDINMTYIVNQYQAAGSSMTVEEIQGTIGSQVANGILLAPLLNLLPCFGEELGWRGYLLPKMKKEVSMLPMLFINGIIWGLWHAPLTILGHNYGTGYMGYPVLGIVAMCLFCFIIGTIFTYITIKTQSIFPAVLAHGALNGFAAIGACFTVDGGNPFVGPGVTGIVGGSAFIVCAIVCTVKLCKQNPKKSEI